jgi:hypothetical protein
MRAGMTEKTGQMMPWDVPANAQAPSTLATGRMMGSELIGGAKHTRMEHPVINADRSGITGNIGGGRLNPYGGGALQQIAMPLRYAPTNEMPGGRLFPEGLTEPRMGGEVVPSAQQGSAGGWGREGRVRNGNAEPTLNTDNFGSSFY